MATYIVTQCECGRAAQVYVPKEVWYPAAGRTAEEGRQADLQDIEDGDFEAPYIAELTGQAPPVPRPRVTGRKAEPPAFPTHCVCGRKMPTAEEIAAHMAHSRRDGPPG